VHINATLIGQMITFALFIWFTMKFVWPPITKALADRQKQIADGLEAAERGRHELDLAQQRAVEKLREAKSQAADVIEQANQRASHIVEEAKENARVEGERLLVLAKADIQQERHKAKEQLLQEVAALAMMGAEKILQRQIDAKTNSQLIDQLIEEI
jgi:F-type H+-transporting ATPase subunit b